MRRRVKRTSAGAPGGRGFTLIEVLIVLAIVGITLAMIRLGGGVLDRVSGWGAGHDERELVVRRFVRSVAGASELALIQGRPIALELATGRYRFNTLDAAGRWVAIENDPVFAEYSLPKDWRWEAVQRDGDTLEAPYRLVFGNEPMSFSILIGSDDRRFVVRGNAVGAVDWVVQ